MIRISVGLLIAVSCFGQGQQNITQTGVIDASGLTSYKPPLKTVGTLPTASSNTNIVFVVTDGTSASDCTVGGAAVRSLCISNGTIWVALGGGSTTGTVTVVSSGSLTSTALVTGGGSQTLQTAAATATMDSSGNISTPGNLTGAEFIGGTTFSAAGNETATPSAPSINTLVFNSTTHLPTYTKATDSTIDGTMVAPAASRTANQFVTNIPNTGVPTTALIAAADLPAIPLPTPSAAFTITLPNGFGKCTTTCTVTVPAPTAAGDQFCIWNGVGVSTAITLSAISGVQYSKADRSAYGTANTAATATAAAGNAICMVAPDTTHWDVLSATGTWTMN